MPSFAGGGDGPRLGRRHPAPRGRLDVHDDRHDDARAAARARRARADPAQGRPRLPQPDALRVGRPRRGVRRCTRGPSTAPRSSARCCSPATRSPTRPSTRATPPSSGTWSTSRTGRSASRCSAACRRAPTRTAGSRRWRTTASTSGAGCCRAWRRGSAMTERFDYVVVGLGGLGSAAAWELARRGHRVLGLERFELGHARGASHDTSRILRHSYHTPAYVRLTQEAYADWARLERESGAAAGHHRPAGSTCSRRTRRSRRSTTRSRWTRSASPTRPSTPTQVTRALAAAAGAGRDARALPGRRRDRAGRPHHRGAARPGPARSAPSCATGRRCSPSRTSAMPRLRVTTASARSPAAAWWSRQTRGPTTACSVTFGVPVPAAGRGPSRSPAAVDDPTSFAGLRCESARRRRSMRRQAQLDPPTNRTRACRSLTCGLSHRTQPRRRRVPQGQSRSGPW